MKRRFTVFMIITIVASLPLLADSVVVFFSATGTTERIAERIANEINAPLVEIEPVVPYTSGDLNYRDNSSRTTFEMNDEDSRPEMVAIDVDFSLYDIIFLGYPIWWGEAPRIIDTFLSSIDLMGKTIIPFCTSGSSGIRTSERNLQAKYPDANWHSGTRFSSRASDMDTRNFVSSI